MKISKNDITYNFREKIYKTIRALDRNSEVISSLSLENNLIKYSDEIIQHRVINELKDEELVRAFLIVKLVKTLHYPISSIELEKEYEAGRPKNIKPRIDILVRDDKNKSTFLFIEVKAPEKYEQDQKYIEGQLFKLARQENKVKYLVYYSVEFKGVIVTDKAIIVDFNEYPNFEDWGQAGRISLDTIPKEFGIARKSIYKNKNDDELGEGEKNLNKSFNREQFFSLRKDLHNVLWGGGGNYNYIFSNLIKIFLAKIYDEYNTEQGKAYKFQIELKGEELEGIQEIYEKINNLFKSAQKELLNYSEDKIRNSVGIDQEQISDSKVAYAVERLQGISIVDNCYDGDVLGEFFEGIVSDGFKQSKGQFFTHTNIVRFILYSLGLDNLTIELINDSVKPRLPYICDSSCGSGTFLIEAMKIITKTVKGRKHEIRKTSRVEDFIVSNFPDRRENIWAREFIYGVESDTDLGLTTKVNMILHQDGNINIFVDDGLQLFEKYLSDSPYGNLLNHITHDINFSYKYPVNERFDLVISNPPFSIDLDTEISRSLPNRFMFAEIGNSENLFIERWYQLLKEGGRLGVVLPESVFDTTENKYIRLFLYKYFKILSVISLPQLAFQPYTPTKTSLLFAQKKNKEDVKNYEEKWREYSNEYQKLKRLIKKYLDGVIEDEKLAKSNLQRYLRDYFDVADIDLSTNDILAKYQDEVEKINSEEKQPDGSRINEWWVFGEVSKYFNYTIFMAEVDEIGFKRGKRSIKERPNELYKTDDKGNIIIDTKDPKTILDYLRKFLNE